jgi:hypothetical protein
MDDPIPQEITIPNRPKMPSPFDRSNLKDQIKTKQTCSPLDLAKLPTECDQLLNLQPIIHQKDEEIDCGDLFGSKYCFQKIFVSYFSSVAGSTFDITSSHHDTTLPTTSSPTQRESIHRDNIGNFDVTMDDFFPASQTSPTLQLNDMKSQAKSLFDDDDGMDDEELLEAFNQHIQSSNEITNPSPILVLTSRINTQIPTADITLPKFDLEFSFDDLDNSDEPLQT